MRTYEQSWAPHQLFEARRLFAEADKVSRGNARICAMLGHTYVRAYADPLAPDLGQPEVLSQGYDLVSQAVGLDPNLPLARAQLGWALFWMARSDLAVPEYERAFALNPNFSDWRFPIVLVYAGTPKRFVMLDLNVAARLTALGGTRVTGSAAEFGKLVSEETEKWGKVIKFAGIQVE